MEEIDIRDLFTILLKRLWLIAVVTLVSAVTAALISFFFLEPVYEAEARLMILRTVSAEQGYSVYNDLFTNRQLASTYSEIACSRTVSQEVIQRLVLPLSSEQLKKKITVSPIGDTEIISLKIQDNNPQQAMQIANMAAIVFRERITEIMNVDNVQIIDPAVRPVSPVAPRPMLNIVIAAVLGLMIGVFWAYLLEYLDTTFKTADEVETVLDLPVLGVIPDFKEV